MSSVLLGLDTNVLRDIFARNNRFGRLFQRNRCIM